MNIIDVVEKESMKEKVPQFKIGDLVDVHVKTIEGDKERIQIFNGMVIKRKGSGPRETFTVRRVVQGEGVERIFPVHSPNVADVKVKKSHKTRRAKLYFLRDRKGKGARLKEFAEKRRKQVVLKRRLLLWLLKNRLKQQSLQSQKRLQKLRKRRLKLLKRRMKNDQLNPKELCIKGEDLAGKFLKKSGYKILKRNYVSKYGEMIL